MNAGVPAAQAAGESARKSATRGSGKASAPGGRKDNKKAGKKTGRRIGRPAGPDRTPLTVRILDEIDQALTLAVEDTGKSPQYIADEALRSWLTSYGYMGSPEKAS
ncbi:hypothetical protein [Amycolatopsis sp. NPDC051903]|uniref:hypothetical protein n=1 Tax=Amycolatopsis sp. NPDC051903 TaxID=3363936 RepID=UPI00378E0A05